MLQEQYLAANDIAKMNTGQKFAFDSVIDSVYNNKVQLFFLNGLAGRGKTFCHTSICHKSRGDGKIVLCVPSSGIAALLLQGEQTAHSTFKFLLMFMKTQLAI